MNRMFAEYEHMHDVIKDYFHVHGANCVTRQTVQQEAPTCRLKARHVAFMLPPCRQTSTMSSCHKQYDRLRAQGLLYFEIGIADQITEYSSRTLNLPQSLYVSEITHTGCIFYTFCHIEIL